MMRPLTKFGSLTNLHNGCMNYVRNHPTNMRKLPAPFTGQSQARHTVYFTKSDKPMRCTNVPHNSCESLTHASQTPRIHLLPTPVTWAHGQPTKNTTTALRIWKAGKVRGNTQKLKRLYCSHGRYRATTRPSLKYLAHEYLGVFVCNSPHNEDTSDRWKQTPGLLSWPRLCPHRRYPSPGCAKDEISRKHVRHGKSSALTAGIQHTLST